MTKPAYYDLCEYDDFLYDIAPSAGLRWFLEVDWDNDGVYDGSNDGLNLVDLKTRRGRQYFLRSDNTGLEAVITGEMECELDNSDGRYNPLNAASPLYPNVAPGVPFRLRVRDLATDTLHDIMTGNLTDVQPHRSAQGLERCKLRGEDAGTALKDTDVTVAVQSSYRTDQAIGAILTAAGWTAGTNLDSYADTMAYWWATGNSAWSEIHDLIDASLGKFFIAADGRATFYSRLRGRSVVQSLAETDIQRDYGIPALMPWQVVRNDVRLKVNTRTVQATSELWRLSDTPLVRAGESLDLWIDYRYNNASTPATNVITPVATTDYLANSAADGSGANLTASFTVAAYKFAETTNLVITNTGGVDGYVTLLKVRGDAMTTTPVTLIEKAASGALRRFVLDSDWLQSVNTAADILVVLYDYLSSAQLYPRVQVLNSPVLQFTPDLFDLQALSFPSKSIAATYETSWIEHQWVGPLGQVVRTTFYFEPQLGGSFWIFPATVGTTTKFGA